MEFHAVILCGEGHRMSPFSSVRSSGLPKALLPVANHPMLCYVMEWCEQANFNGITIIVPEDYIAEFKYYVEEIYLKGHTFKHIEVIGSGTFRHTGEMVGSLSQKITSDFVVLPCDFITDLPAQYLIDIHRNRADDTLVTGIYYKNNLENIEKKSLISDYLIHTPLTDQDPRLLDFYTKDVVKDKKALDIRARMLGKYPNTIISTHILRASIFFCSKNLWPLLSQESHSTLGNLLEAPWHKVIRELSRRSWRSANKNSEVEPKSGETVVAFRVLSPSDSTFVRCNNLSAYVEANRYVMRQRAREANMNSTGAQQQQTKQKQPQQPSSTASIGGDSTVGEDTIVGDKTNVKRTVIGNNCNIGKKCRINGCVIMDNVTLEDEVILENCLVGRKAIIRYRSRLTTCNVEANFEVSKQTQAKNETLQSLTMEGLIEEDESVALESSGSDDEDSDEDSDEGEWEEEEEDDEFDGDEDDLFER